MTNRRKQPFRRHLFFALAILCLTAPMGWIGAVTSAEKASICQSIQAGTGKMAAMTAFRYGENCEVVERPAAPHAPEAEDHTI